MEGGASKEEERGAIIQGARVIVGPGEEQALYSTYCGKGMKGFNQGVACSDLCISKSTLASFEVSSLAQVMMAAPSMMAAVRMEDNIRM